MSDPLSSFEPLVPIPFKHTPSPSPRPNTPKAGPKTAPPANYSQDKASSDEPDIDKFATLFNPSTPHASPTIQPIFSQSRPTSSIRSNNRLSQSQIGSTRLDSNDSDFGGFVSVPPAQDPLSQTFFSETPPLEAILTRDPREDSSKTSQRVSHSNSDFFGQFVEGAKEQDNQGKGKGYLDELLRHEDDPLYWINHGGSEPESSGSSRGEESESESGRDDLSNVMSGHALEVSLLDLDLDSNNYFAHKESGHEQNNVTSQSSAVPVKPKLKPFATPSMSPTFPFAAPRPPISHSSNSSVSTSAPSPSASPPIPSSTSPRPTYPTQPSRWMSSLLSNPRTSIDDQSRPSVQGIFPHPRASSTDALQHQIRHPSPPLPHSSLPASVSTSSTISHGTPFASRSYIPASGAPGFAGSDHAWDKGFSDDFEKDGKKAKEHVHLEGLKAATEGILDLTLVDLVCL